jgi:CO/xanthine dehydrogenase FAD-binding subunit
LRATEAEQILASEPPGERTFALAASKARENAAPISDVRGGAEYQSMMVHSLTLRGLGDVWRVLSRA